MTEKLHEIRFNCFTPDKPQDLKTSLHQTSTKKSDFLASGAANAACDAIRACPTLSPDAFFRFAGQDRTFRRCGPDSSIRIVGKKKNYAPRSLLVGALKRPESANRAGPTTLSPTTPETAATGKTARRLPYESRFGLSGSSDVNIVEDSRRIRVTNSPRRRQRPKRSVHLRCSGASEAPGAGKACKRFAVSRRGPRQLPVCGRAGPDIRHDEL